MKSNQASLIKKIISFLLLVLILTTIGTGVLRYLEIRSSTNRSAANLTTQAASQIALMMDKATVDECMSNPTGDATQNLKQRLREMCNVNSLEYLYVYIPDIENRSVTFVIVAAADDAHSPQVNENLTAGKTQKMNLESAYDAVKRAWAGEKNVSTRMQNAYGDFTTSFTMIKEGNEKVALVGAGYDTRRIVKSALIELTAKMLVSLLVWVLVLVIIGIYLKRKITSPVLCIADKMKAFTSDMQSNSFEPLDFKTGDEIQTVADSFNKLTNELNLYVDEVKRFAAEEAKISTEVDVARRIQYGVVAAHTERDLSDTLQLSCRMNSARSVGGDFYDYFQVEDGVHCVLIADVSGKGIGAAMFMMLSKAILHEKLINTNDPAKAVSEANDEICANNPENMFATAFVALIDENNNQLSYVNAGHNAPIIVKNSIAQALPVQTGIALGLFDSMSFTLETVPLEKGDALIMYTDGVTESINEQEQFFGEEALIKTVQSSYDTKSNYCDKIFEDIDTFRKTAEQFDDITIVAVNKK